MNDSRAQEPSGSGETPQRRLRALAFGGGAFDTIMQLGVVHALLVSRGKAPDHVVGVSAGAVNAAALADVLQAGNDPSLTSDQQMEQRVRRLRYFLDTYLELPGQLLASTLPDTFEIRAKQPLQPLELPIHVPEERSSRADAVRNKAGLIRLMNHLLSIRLPVSTLTRIVRRVLAFAQAGELKRPIKPRETIVWNAVALWITSLLNFYAMGEVLLAVVQAAVVGESGTMKRFTGRVLSTLARAFHWTKAENWVHSRMNRNTATAADIINKWRISRLLGAVTTSSLATIFFLAVWTLPLAVTAIPPETLPELERLIPQPPFVDTNEAKVGEAYKAFGTAVHNLWLTHRDTVASDSAFLMKAMPKTGKVVARYAASRLMRYRFAMIALLATFILAASLEILLGYRWAAAFLVFMICFGCGQVWQRHVFVISSFVGVVLVQKNALRIRTRIMRHYEIADGFLSRDALLQAMVTAFDPKYFGSASLQCIIDAALRRANQVQVDLPAETHEHETLQRFSKGVPHIHVGPVAADLASGKLEVLPETTNIVDALLAATAMIPLFGAKDPARPRRSKIGATLDELLRGKNVVRRWMIDGINVSNEPIQPLIDHLRDRYKEPDPSIKTVDIYPVSDLPVDKSTLPTRGNFNNLVDVGLRGLELKQFRDATMERRLTRLFTKALPDDQAFHTMQEGKSRRTYIHAGIFPIEMDRPARINRRLTRGATAADYKRILRETVADGCRASLEAMIPRQIASHVDRAGLEEWVERNIGEADRKKILASAVFPLNLVSAEESAAQVDDDEMVALIVGGIEGPDLEVRVEHTAFVALTELLQPPRCMKVIGAENALIGSDGRSGPGISEICQSCRLNRPVEESATLFWKRRGEMRGEALPYKEAQRLRVHPDRQEWPQWPHERAQESVAGEAPDIRLSYGTYKWPAEAWPAQPDAPVISFLFGGGVFRGVFHMGVMNALNEAGLQPDLVAGSSVGSIIAAMIAAVFKRPATMRQRAILDLASTFVAIDRLILTDRLADFVRRFTLRAAEAEFSPRDLDLVLRRFDYGSAEEFNKRARRVSAGLERLFYFSPFELFTVMRELRLQQRAAVLSELLGDVQELLDRGGISQEILGSEPLSLLIQQHVIEALGDPFPSFRSFLKGNRPIYFLATATNLHEGGLEILGAPWLPSQHVSLEHGLLASSAFPAVFRPRHAWEIFPNSRHDHKYIDGGTIDNLPLDAVARFLDEAERHGKIVRRPSVPHLLFTASLEVDRATLGDDPRTLNRMASDVIALMKRASTLKYNRKINAYARMQQRLRAIWKQYHDRCKWDRGPLDLEVVAVKPKWLCGTFGFHPMLGFRRDKQARSIAHGCASTLVKLAGISTEHPKWAEEWGIARLNIHAGINEDNLVPNRQGAKEGQCWFRNADHLCPFSREAIEKYNKDAFVAGRKTSISDLKTTVSEIQIVELNRIYESCGRKQTHVQG